MGKVSLLRSFLYNAYSTLIMPMGVLAIALVMTNNLPMLSLHSEDLLIKADYSPRSRVLGVSENLTFQRFVFLRTHFVMRNQCSVRPEIYSVIQKNKALN